MRTSISSLLLAMCIMLVGCSDSSTDTDEGAPPPPETEAYMMEAAFPNLSFSNPLDLQHPDNGSEHLYVAEQNGVIKKFQNEISTSETSVFLDIQNRVVSGGERGLLGFAFHPDFESNGYVYVHYTTPDPLRSRISRFETAGGQADPNSELIILSYEQPFTNHNGGQVRFGPDGYLYISAGDGGGSGDPEGNGQDRTTLLGSILRIDVNSSENGNNYAIPDSNPFTDNVEGYREEIYAYGLRNPFRFSFDSETGELWTGDVGQNRFEEINIIESGKNYGWNILEGNQCYDAEECDRSGLTLPVYIYDHSNNDRSVTGGFVYRGSRLDRLQGYYIYADFISGRIWALDGSNTENPDNTLLVESGVPISSFGIDASNELYITAFDGSVYTLSHINE